MELPDGLTEPNAGAYTKTETREGHLLGIANDQGIFGRLPTMSHDEFDAWLRRITEEGSVT